MEIEIKKTTKPVEYKEAIDFLEKRLVQINHKKETELIWILEHPSIYTAGTSYNENEILDKSINVVKTNRGGKITYHGPGQTICYFVINLNKKNKELTEFSEALKNYRERKWAPAITKFKSCLKDCPEDGAAELYLDRCKVFKKTPPPKDWKGEQVFTQK